MINVLYHHPKHSLHEGDHVPGQRSGVTREDVKQAALTALSRPLLADMTDLVLNPCHGRQSNNNQRDNLQAA